jgi:single-strand DNA-binding protein
MLMIGLARIGNEPVVRFTKDNKPVLDLSLAYNYGRKGDDGKQPTQWVNGTMFGDRVEKLAPYLSKGSLILVNLEDVHIESYTRKDGSSGVALRGRISSLEFAGGNNDRKVEPKEQPKQEKSGSFDDLDDDVPF